MELKVLIKKLSGKNPNKTSEWILTNILNSLNNLFTYKKQPGQIIASLLVCVLRRLSVYWRDQKSLLRNNKLFLVWLLKTDGERWKKEEEKTGKRVRIERKKLKKGIANKGKVKVETTIQRITLRWRERERERERNKK